MKIISHRGNLTGPHTAKYGENHPESIKYILRETPYDVEIDVWKINDVLFLGHDSKKFVVPEDLFNSNQNLDVLDRIWVHCKNIEALNWFITQSSMMNVFFHDKDSVTIVYVSGHIWGHPNIGATGPHWEHFSDLVKKNYIQVLPERTYEYVGLEKFIPRLDSFNDLFGVCTDYPEHFSPLKWI